MYEVRAHGRLKAVAWSNGVDAQRAVIMLWWNIRACGRRVVPRAAAWYQAEATGKVLEGIHS
jgi:hypothetical protein